MPRYTINDLLEMERHSTEDRIDHALDVTIAGVAKGIIELKSTPWGFSSLQPVEDILANYYADYRILQHFAKGPRDVSEYLEIMKYTYGRNQDTMSKVACAVLELQEKMRAEYGGDLSIPGELQHLIPAIQDIQDALDRFFTLRTTNRLIMRHTVGFIEGGLERMALPYTSIAEPTFMVDSDPWYHRVYSSGAAYGGRVGTVCTQTSLIGVLQLAFEEAVKSYEAPNEVPEILVNNRPLRNCIVGEECVDLRFPYVDTHLYYIFLELLKNAIRASVEGARVRKTPVQPITVWFDEAGFSGKDRSIKISDQGCGISRDALRKIWSYFYCTDPAGKGSQANLETSAGRGFGLPIVRVLLNYFDGQIDIRSVPGKSTDVYLYL